MNRQTRVVIQSRMSSRRLPGKALLPIAGLPMVVLAARRVMAPDCDVVVATSTEVEDDVIAETLGDHGVACVRGQLDDPLSRFVLAARGLADTDVVVRLTADNVFPDADLVRWLVDHLDGDGRSYVRVGGAGASVPYGVSAEAFLAGPLRRADREAVRATDREHVTPHIRQSVGDEHITPADMPSSWSRLRCTVDNPLDYERVWRAFDREPDPIGVSWRQLCERLPATALRPRDTSARNSIGQSDLVLGTAQLGQPYGIANKTGEPTDLQARRLLVAAATQGVTHVDTARAYGRSEEKLGRAMDLGLSEQLRLITKVRPLNDLPVDAPQAWAELAVRESVTGSLRALRTESVDALLLHNAEDLAKGDGAVLRELVRMRDDGVTQLVGVSVQSPSEMLAVLAGKDVGYVQFPFNVLDGRWETDAIRDAVQARPDVLISARSVFLQGLLVADTAKWPHVNGFDAQRLHRVLRDVSAELGRDGVGDLAMSFVRGHEWVSSLVIGAESEQQVREQARMMNTPALTPAEIAHVRDRVGPTPVELVDPSRWSFR